MEEESFFFRENKKKNKKKMFSQVNKKDNLFNFFDSKYKKNYKE